MRELTNGQSCGWSFESWRKQRQGRKFYKEATAVSGLKTHKIAIHIVEGHWESLKDIQVDREETVVHSLRPKINDISFKIVTEVQLRGNVKVITLRSPIIVRNMCAVPLEMALCSPKMEDGEAMFNTMVVPENDFASFPVHLAYANRIKVKPRINAR